MSARPVIPRKRRTFDARVSFSLNQESYARLAAIADQRQISIGGVLREALMEYLAARPTSKKTPRGNR